MSDKNAATLEQEVDALRERVGEMALVGEELAQVVEGLARAVEGQLQAAAGLATTVGLVAMVVSQLVSTVEKLDTSLDSEERRDMLVTGDNLARIGAALLEEEGPPP